MLFSATMTEKVSELIKLSLKNPVRVSVDPMFQTSQKLQQEFIRVRENRENDREAYLLTLCTRTYKSKVIVFYQQKKTAHRLKIIFGLAGLNAAELHGNLTQAQRLESLEKFRDGDVDYLLATDLAARGLDIVGIETVINYSMPTNMATYVHRVGRTARAEKKGISVSLVGEKERKLLKEIVRHSQNVCKQRSIPIRFVDENRNLIEKMAPDMIRLVEMEKQERLVN
jgi:ATP-dependent RNA helicase DDX27